MKETHWVVLLVTHSNAHSVMLTLVRFKAGEPEAQNFVPSEQETGQNESGVISAHAMISMSGKDRIRNLSSVEIS